LRLIARGPAPDPRGAADRTATELSGTNRSPYEKLTRDRSSFIWLRMSLLAPVLLVCPRGFLNHHRVEERQGFARRRPDDGDGPPDSDLLFDKLNDPAWLSARFTAGHAEQAVAG
jgi:hypothetical protein